MKQSRFPFIALLLMAVFGFRGTQPAGAAYPDDRKLVIWQKGPSTARLKQTATVEVPADFRFADAHSTMRLLRAAGENVSGNEMGMICRPEEDWAIIFQFAEIGQVSTGDTQIDAAEVLRSLNQNNEKVNQERKKTGKPALGKYAWEQKPVYHPANHSLEWATSTESQGQTNIECNFRLLGRKGVMMVRVACDGERWPAVLPVLKEVVSKFSYLPQEKYEDKRFTDKIARGSLETLITGDAISMGSKHGFWATVLLVIKKVLKLLLTLLIIAGVLGGIAAGYYFYMIYFGRRRHRDQPAP